MYYMNKLVKYGRSRVAIGLGVLGGTLIGAQMAFADVLNPTANEAVTGAFADLAADVGATIGVVAASAVSIMLVFLAWKYGRKIFSSVAK